MASELGERSQHKVFYDAVLNGHGDTVRALLDHTDDPEGMLSDTSFDERWDALRLAIHMNRRDQVATMMGHCRTRGLIRSAFECALNEGNIDVIRIVLDGPHVDAVSVLKQKYTMYTVASTELPVLSFANNVVMAEALLGHPAADPAAMLSVLNDPDNPIPFIAGVLLYDTHRPVDGRADLENLVKLYLEHPAAPALRDGYAALVAAADCIDVHIYDAWERRNRNNALTVVDLYDDEFCGVILFMLRRYKNVPQPQPEHVLENALALVTTKMSPVLDEEIPGEKRDECVRILIELGAPFPQHSQKLVSRITREVFRERGALSRELDQMRRMPHAINEATVYMALERVHLMGERERLMGERERLMGERERLRVERRRT